MRSTTLACLSILAFVSISAFAMIEENSIEKALIRYDFLEGEITQLCNEAIENTRKNLDLLVQSNEANALMAFEKITADLSHQGAVLCFMKDVSTKKELRDEASKCEENLSLFDVEIYSRKDLYEKIKNQKNIAKNQERLWKKTLSSFEDNGLSLDDERREKVKALKEALSTLETRFSTNINEDQSKLEFSREELDGLPSGFIENLKPGLEDKLIVPVNAPNYMRITDNAHNSNTRKLMLEAWENRAAEENTKLFEEALAIRKEVASLMTYANWAAFRIKDRMAQKFTTALEFLYNLKEKLSLRNKADLELLLKFKQERDPLATSLDAWDLRYCAYQIKKRDYKLDDEEIRTYFPKDLVLEGMLKIYSQILSVNFSEIKDANVWAEGVQFFQTRDQKTDEIIGYFYTDFIPRDGKFTHAAAFTLRPGRLLDSGTYLAPVSAIVANFTPGENGGPVLLTHYEVETLFHEFGHIMHQTLTRAPFASLAGTSVARDFVEAPSQMLENWVYNAKILTLLSGHYEDHSRKLPQDILDKIIMARDFNQGYFHTRQLVFGLFDLICHTSEDAVDITSLYKKLHHEFVGIPAIENSHFPASWWHPMGGYDAGYYGYLWSEVYAMDMFSRFQKEGLLNSETGNHYRRTILKQGNMKDAMDLLIEFLEREPNSDAFFQKLGIR